MSPESKSVGQILVAHNPYSSNSDRAEQIIEVLESSIWARDLRVIPTKHRRAVDNIDDLAKYLQTGVTLTTLGGDGMTNIGGGAIKVSGTDALLLPLPLGNANDTSLTLYGPEILKTANLFDLLRYGVAQKMGGIAVHRSDTQEVRYGIGYASLGLSAVTAARIDNPEFREKQGGKSAARSFAGEMLEVLKSIHDRENFQYSENGLTKEAVSIEFVSGLRMAKILNFKHGRYGQEMSNIEMGPGPNFMGRVIMQGVRGMLHRLSGDVIDQRELTVLTPTTIQYDGETEPIDQDTTVQFVHHPSLLKVLAPALG